MSANDTNNQHASNNNTFDLNDNPTPYVGVPRAAADVDDTDSGYFRFIATNFSDDPLPWELEDYCNSPYYDARRFAVIANARGPQAYAAYGDRHRALKHRGGVHHDDLSVLEDEPIWSDMPSARNASECEYQRRLYELLQRIAEDFRENRSLLPEGRTLLSLSVLPQPLDRFYLLNRRSEAIRKDVAFETRMRRTNRLFVGYHNVEFHRVPAYDRGRLYLSCNLPYYLDVPAALQVPTPPSMAYMSGIIDAENNPEMVARWWQVAAAEWAELVFHRVMCTAKYGADNASGVIDRRLTGTLDSPAPRGRLFPLPEQVIATWMRMGIANLAHRTEFSEEDIRGVIRTTVMTDWEKAPGFIYYDFESRAFHPMWSEARYGQTDADSIREWPRLSVEPAWFTPYLTIEVPEYARGVSPFSDVPLLRIRGEAEDDDVDMATAGSPSGDTPVGGTTEVESETQEASAAATVATGETETDITTAVAGGGEEPSEERDTAPVETEIQPATGGLKRQRDEGAETEAATMQLGERREASVGHEVAPKNAGDAGVKGKFRVLGTRFRTAMDAVRDKILTSGSGDGNAAATATAVEASGNDTPIEVINLDGSSSGSMQPPRKARKTAETPRVDTRAAALPDFEMEPDSGLTSSQYAPDYGVFTEGALLERGRSQQFSSGVRSGILGTPFAARAGERELDDEVTPAQREAAFHSLQRVFGSRHAYTHSEIYRVIPLLCQRLVMAQEALALGREQQMRLIRLQERMADIPPVESASVRQTLNRANAFLMPQVASAGGSVRTTRLPSDLNISVVARPQVPIAGEPEEFDWAALDESDEQGS